jgi:hypothetical protein
MTERSLGKPIIFGQTYRDARPISIGRVGPTDIDALREHRGCELRLRQAGIEEDEVGICLRMFQF